MGVVKYDIIGDVHGHAQELETLLGKLSYRKDRSGAHHHEEQGRKAIFIGDYIDRGPEQFEALDIVRKMVESGNALALMGNHEYNAAMYHSYAEKDGELTPLRPHTKRNANTHKAFLNAAASNPRKARDHINWIKQLPVCAQVDGMRLVHAMWDDAALATLRDTGVIDGDYRVARDGWQKLADEKSPQTVAIELMLKGLEIQLPAGISFVDGHGQKREQARVKWWIDINQPDLTLDKVVLGVKPGDIEPLALEHNIRTIMQTAQGTGPVFFGHYWQQGEHPAIECPSAICLDQSVALGGHLAAATVEVENGVLHSLNFTSVKSFAREQALAMLRA